MGVSRNIFSKEVGIPLGSRLPAALTASVAEIKRQRAELANNWPKVEETIGNLHFCQVLPFDQGKLHIT